MKITSKGWTAFAIFAVFSLMFPVLVAFASSYAITYDFDSNLTGPTRSFDGQNIAVYLNSHYDAHVTQPDNTFTVELYRHEGWFSDSFIGRGIAPSEGTTTIMWSNVGPGNYYLQLHHGPFGYWVHGNGTIYNY